RQGRPLGSSLLQPSQVVGSVAGGQLREDYRVRTGKIIRKLIGSSAMTNIRSSVQRLCSSRRVALQVICGMRQLSGRDHQGAVGHVAK
ncbi:hypothetical protein, partial [Mesorhizobium sp. M2D.F.Ca.ET.206.01.1.1]|uniref:hypothetical protein n=1 Tax=Mesorhizobium sp. M2D.F.Ca.ET.206.01.1.1 TaxID=2563939 RepID=UPI001AEED90B